MSLRICIIGPTYPFRGGIAHYMTLLYEHIKKRHQTLFISFKRQYPKLIFPGKTDYDNSSAPLKSEGVERLLDSMNPFTWIAVVRRVIKYHPDLLIIPWWVAFWTPQFVTITTLVKLFSRTKVLYICHNVVEHESSWWKKLCTALVLRKGDFFIVHSAEDEHNLRQIVTNPDVHRNFLPTYDIFSTLQEQISRETAKKQLGLSDKEVILFFGFVRPYKGLDYLLRAFADVLRRNRNAHLMIVGEFWKDRDQYDRLISQLDLAKYITVIDRYIPNEEVSLYFIAADCVAIPYTSATGSAIIQMAYGFGRAVIVTNVGSLPEIVDDAKTGYIVQSRNVEQLAQALEKLLKNRQYLEFEKNVEKIRYKFSWDRMVDTIEGFFSS